MSEDGEVDLAFLGHQLRQVLTEVGALRADVNVLTAMAMRQDNTLAAMLTEVRAMHAQHSRLAHRVRALEGTQP